MAEYCNYRLLYTQLFIPIKLFEFQSYFHEKAAIGLENAKENGLSIFCLSI